MSDPNFRKQHQTSPRSLGRPKQIFGRASGGAARGPRFHQNDINDNNNNIGRGGNRGGYGGRGGGRGRGYARARGSATFPGVGPTSSVAAEEKRVLRMIQVLRDQGNFSRSSLEMLKEDVLGPTVDTADVISAVVELVLHMFRKADESWTGEDIRSDLTTMISQWHVLQDAETETTAAALFTSFLVDGVIVDATRLDTLSELLTSCLRCAPNHRKLRRTIKHIASSVKMHLGYDKSSKFTALIAYMDVDAANPNDDETQAVAVADENGQEAELYRNVTGADISQLEICPTLDDLRDFMFSALPKMILGRPIRSLEALLEIVFKVSRADFIAPLNDALPFLLNPREYQRYEQKFNKRKRLGVYTYGECKYKSTGFRQRKGVYHEFQLSARSRERLGVAWLGRMMDGNLLMVYTPNNNPAGGGVAMFSSVMWGTAVRPSKGPNEDPFAKQGCFQISFLHPVVLDPSVDYTVVESKMFYVPLQRSLSCLQRLQLNDSLEAALLRAETTPPAYVMEKPTFNFDDVVVCTQTTWSVRDPNAWGEHMPEWSAEAEAEVGNSMTRHLLDGTQRDALRHIFSNNIAIVQGTPGTGKTFIGSKFVQLLLENQHKSPILVACYTNHAIDAFLHDLINLGLDKQHMVRLGGASKDPDIAQLSLFKKTFLRTNEQDPPVDELNELQSNLADLERGFIKIVMADKTNSVPNSIAELLRRLNSEFLQFNTTEKKCNTEAKYLAQEMKGLESRLKTVTDQMKCADCCPVDEDVTAESVRAEFQAMCMREFGEEIPFPEFEEWLRAVEYDMTPEFMPWYNEIKATTHRLKGQLKYVKQRDEQKTLREQLQGVRKSLEISRQTLRSSVDPLSQWLGSVARAKILLSGFAEWIVLQTCDDKTLNKAEREDVAEANNANGNGDLLAADAAQQMAQRYVEDGENNNVDDNDGADQRPAAVVTASRSRLDIAAITREMHELCGNDNILDSHAPLPKAKKEQLFTLILKFTYAQLQEAQQETYDVCELITRQNEERRMKAIGQYLRGQKVIAATTTAAATFINALRGAGVKVVIVEEAAEVLEAHTLSMLTSGVEHVVLIGDHKQLRPKVENHTIARDHGLAISMMERLVRMGMPFVTLTCQRRMHPTISEITKKYYRVCPQQPVNITDHPTTLQRSVALGVSCKDEDNVAGHVLVIAHDNDCTMHASSDSPMNYHEAEGVLATALFLSSHFVDSKRITVLTPYKGQLFTLQDIARRNRIQYITSQNNQGIRIAVVDDYQGEESDIILLSLVRTSNAGFLRDERRTCVALSRARCALIVFGNRHVFRSDVSNYLLADLWDAAVKGQFAFGEGRYPACCSVHQRSIAFADFLELSKTVGVNGGCKEVCGAQRQCGHACAAVCHPKDKCDTFNCLAPCTRMRVQCTPPRTCDHPCQTKCFQECGKCMFMVDYTCKECEAVSQVECHSIATPKCINVIEQTHPRCGDVVAAQCFLWTEAMCMTNDETSRKALTTLSLACRAKCEHQLRCGHRCPNRCADCFKKQVKKANVDIHDKMKCNELVCVPNPICGHPCEKSCGAEVFPECAKSCDKRLPCGHKCSGTCGRCEATGHPACTHMVTIKRTKCAHGDVSVKCCERDEPCQERCMHTLKCGHQCRGACGVCAPSTHFCDEQCGRNLSCGHKCTGSCSRDCPPCKQKCNRGCEHSQCSSKKKSHECGTCIDLCSRECGWKCKHEECTLRCHEVCTRDACLESCQMRLSCGHACAGLCGDACPRLCPDCFAAGDNDAKDIFDKNMRTLCDTPAAVAAVLSKGTDYVRSNVDTRIVQLECRCMFFVEEVLAHTKALLSVSHDGGEITAPRCPSCNQNITYKTLFYTRVVKQHQHAINMINQRKVAVKNKHSDTVRAVVAAGVVAVRSIHYALNGQSDPPKERLDSASAVPVDVVRFIKQPQAPPKGLMKGKIQPTKFKAYKLQLRDYEDSVRQQQIFWDKQAAEYLVALPGMSPLQRCLHDASKAIFSRVRGATTEIDTEGLAALGSLVDVGNNVATIAEILLTHCPATHVISGDEITHYFSKHPVDARSFAVFAKHLALLLRITRVMEHDTSRVNVLKNARADLEHVIKRNNSEDDAVEVDAAVYDVLAEVEKTLSSFPTRQELETLTRALNVSGGHWYQCPKGHLYVIGDCGGAMVRSVCPECGAGIGGEQHRLDSTNMSAAHLLGATPAWPRN